jgi:diacylglycerol kinase (ATP)
MHHDEPMSEIALLVNPAARAGRAASDLPKILDRLAHHGLKPEVLETQTPEAVSQAIVTSSAERILLAGGDGVLHHALPALAHCGRILGLIPSGTGNDAARAWGLLAGDLASQVDRALADPTAIDLITGGPQPVATSVIAGFPTAVNERANTMRFPKGSARYTMATLAELPKMQPQDYCLTLDGQAHQIKAAVVAVANTAFFGAGMAICPNADPTDGVLDICVVGDVGRLGLLRSFTKIRSGSHVGHPKVTMFRATEVSVQGAGPARGDGETLSELPLTLRSDPGALLVAGVGLRSMHD